MFDIGFFELVVVGVLVLVFLDPKEIPEIVKRVIGIKNQILRQVDELKKEVNVSEETAFDEETNKLLNDPAYNNIRHLILETKIDDEELQPFREFEL